MEICTVAGVREDRGNDSLPTRAASFGTPSAPGASGRGQRSALGRYQSVPGYQLLATAGPASPLATWRTEGAAELSFAAPFFYSDAHCLGRRCSCRHWR